jgi:hypothetical protein
LWVIQRTKLNEPHSFFLFSFRAAIVKSLVKRWWWPVAKGKKCLERRKEEAPHWLCKCTDDFQLDLGHTGYSFVSNSNIQNTTKIPFRLCVLLTARVKVCYVTWMVGVFIYPDSFSSPSTRWHFELNFGLMDFSFFHDRQSKTVCTFWEIECMPFCYAVPITQVENSFRPVIEVKVMSCWAHPPRGSCWWLVPFNCPLHAQHL